MPEQTPELTAVFGSLSDPTRRRVVERLGHGPAATSELAARFEMALPSFIQHLDVLEGAGIVRSEKRGRVRTYDLLPEALSVMDTWMAAQRRTWEARLDQLDAYVRQLHEDGV